MNPVSWYFCLIYQKLYIIMSLSRKVTMTIIISPSKTMKLNTNKPKTNPMFKEQSNQIQQWLNKLSLQEVMNFFNISEKLALSTMKHIQSFGKEAYPAIYTYQGTQYKYIDIDNYSPSELAYMDKHVMILSGMYGLLRSFDGISLYRMPMHLVFQGESLYNFWKQTIKELLDAHEVINLCSDEYGLLLQKELKNVTSIVFYQDNTGKKKTPSMEAKMMRGLMLKEIVHQQLESKEMIKQLHVGGYRYDPAHSNEGLFAFVKQYMDV